MLFKQATLGDIAAGKVTLAFRRWRRPTVRAGGTLTTPVGVLAIDAVEKVAPTVVTVINPISLQGDPSLAPFMIKPPPALEPLSLLKVTSSQTIMLLRIQKALKLYWLMVPYFLPPWLVLIPMAILQ